MFNRQSTDHQCQGHSFAGGKCADFKSKFWSKAAPLMNHFTGRIPANIEETDQGYNIYLYAAGLQKDKIVVSVKNDMLSVSYPGAVADTPKFVHAEYQTGNFERLFQLNSQVLTTAIQASYSDGVLKITLAKNPGTNKPLETVTVN
ncbi:MAG: Hsp20/alpha crystallin family protein [Chitinophagaceae bacterium]